jgi:serine/threonine-protein kinase
MIGRYGEVYLVDWGIAVSVRTDASGRVPLASEATEMAGTPAYMAPEMLGSSIGKLSERTDVYLLGAVLHEILTGKPPHHSEVFRQIVTSILTSQIVYGPDIPSELAAIAKRAMARDAAQRFASADEMRLRLEWYLRHRGSLALSREAAERVAKLRELVEPEAATDAGIRERVYRLFSEARFGFRQALAASEDNASAKSGLREATALVAEYDLGRGRPEAAAAALAEIDDPPPSLVARVADAMRARAAEKERLERLEKLDADLDPRTGRRTRVTIAAVVGVFWTIVPEVCGWYERRHEDIGPTHVYLFTFAIFLPPLALAFWGRDSMSRTAVNRRIIATGLVLFSAMFALELGCTLLGIDLVRVTVLLLLVFFLLAAAIAVNTDSRLWPATVVFLAAFLGAAAFPSLRWHFMAIADFVLLVNFVVAWSSKEDDPRFVAGRTRYHLVRLLDRVRGGRSK